MKIGIGVVSYLRPKHLDLWREQVLKYAPKDYELSIYIDEPRMGIAFGKNQNLRDLKHCDYIFLMDSDCFPIKTGWAEFFIEASKAIGQQHFMYLKQTPTIRLISAHIKLDNCPDILNYNNCAGCMMFLTKEVIEKVGAYNPEYGYYAFEHAGYSNRIHKAGLTPLGAYTCPAGAGEYVYSLDLDNHLPFNKQVKHEPSMAKEIRNIPQYIEQNKQVYLRDTEIYIPLV